MFVDVCSLAGGCGLHIKLLVDCFFFFDTQNSILHSIDPRFQLFASCTSQGLKQRIRAIQQLCMASSEQHWKNYPGLLRGILKLAHPENGLSEVEMFIIFDSLCEIIASVRHHMESVLDQRIRRLIQMTIQSVQKEVKEKWRNKSVVGGL